MLKVLRMSADKSLRRLSNLHGLWVGQGKSPRSLQIEPCRCCSNTVKDPGQVSIGDVSVAVKPPQHPEYVPHKYLKEKASQSTLRHLRWIMQKDQLGQDVFLIGPPGPVRRQLAMMYLELTKREGEYVSLSRDTTEADLKQRREIKAGTAFYLDQAAVRAAVEGRVLVLEGIEKAERNVLPVLNNLLENREMQLEDGRFLVAPDRYDKLLKDHTREELEDLKLVRVDERFRVIALGLPVPRYQGNPLDPPLRSRFQARDINPLPYHVLMFATTLLTAESTTLGLPDFPVANLPELAKILKFNVPLAKTTEGQLESVDRQTNNAQVHVTLGNRATDFEVSKGTLDGSGHQDHAFITTPYHNTFLTDMLQSHMVKDFCVIGPRFASLLGYHSEVVMLYQDMTSRDLLQQRTTSPSGDTAWRLSPLVTAALEGSLAVLDGVHRINPGSFSVLQRLVHDRELQLFDGSRLLGKERYEAVKAENNLTDAEMEERGILRIHPSFRILALGEPPVTGSSTGQWLSPEMLSLFLYHNMRPLTHNEEEAVKDCPDLTKLLTFTHRLRNSTDPTISSIAASLSSRQLIRVARRLANFPTEDLYSITALEQSLEDLSITPPAQPTQSIDNIEKSITCEVKDNKVRIGTTVADVYDPDNKTKVPDVLFYENTQHLCVMEDMLKDFLLGEHLLLVGNQGVGKNKIPTVQDGVIIYEDSPLVRAVKMGHVLVVDEADKAPTHVTCILKTLVESGEMHLADGRRIVAADSGLAVSDKIIVSHQDFRMIVLANRPGFPFLGNDFFGAMGDIFSCHGIDNPDKASEMAMLRQYGPDVSEQVLEKLVLSFGELRNMADQGLIAYPYSTREVVNMVLISTMQKHGIPLGARPDSIQLAKELPLPRLELTGQWTIQGDGGRRRTSLLKLPTETYRIGVKGPVSLRVETETLERTEARADKFSEQEAYWQVPLHESNIISDLAVSLVGLYSMSTRAKSANHLDMYDIFPMVTGSYRPHVRLMPLAAPLDDTVVLHEEVTNTILAVNYENGEINRLVTPSLPQTAPERRRFTSPNTTKTGISQHVPLPLKVANVTQVGSQTWMLSEDKTNKKFLVTRSGVADFTLQAIMEDNVQSVLGSSAVPMSDAALSASLGEQTSGSNRVLSTPESYASIALGFPEAGTSRVYSSRRPAGEGGNTDQDSLLGRVTGKSGAPSPSPSSLYLPGCAQLVRTLPNWKAPEGVLSKDQRAHTSGLLEVADLPNQKLRYVPVPGATRQSPYASWLFNLHESSVLVSQRSADGLVTVTYEKESARTADGPKHGKEDKNNDPHVGGNTWAGGTGGSNTAGLGGFGGPYRLDAGHDVTQVPQLREIQMSEYDAETYETFSKHVRRQVQALRVVIDSLQAKSKERQWLKNQPHGDLDDAKLIDGLTGERNVYKRRGEKEPEMGGQQEHPKLLRLLVDCSGSMYRFNGHDGRLEREMEASIMAMEALEGHEEKIKFDIWGHSGEDHRVALSTFDKPPNNNKERLQVVKTMHAHSQFCLSGDTTLQATKHAIEMLAKEDADERFLIVLSDANFDRYGIPPSRFGEILRSHDEVNAFAIFIGSLGDQATRLTKQLPMGHSFVCLDTKNLPQILQQIFTSTMLAK
ncbi:VWA8-like protein [Mya arenaria]|uniref:VWA8-like protein n=1 Tax=Mya arenaria TaxID=6604 RepID=A0ABY7EZ48_MYAAR|nr:VWA8-like protein [Mya arenaria]